MTEEEQYRQTYGKIQAAQDQQEQSYLVDVFSRCWKNKFYSFPLFPTSNYHFVQMRNLKKEAGDKAAELIEHYFEIKDEWFIKQAYSLDCLCKNINKVNASLASRATHERAGDLLIRYACDACEKQIDLRVPSNYKFIFERCEDCIKANRPFKFSTKEERARSVIGMGQAILNLEEKPE